MNSSRKARRSGRHPVEHRLLLTILGPSGSEIAKEIVTTVEVSLHGARVRGVRTFRLGSQGLLTQLGSGVQAPVRVAWQARVLSNPKFLDTGVEILSAFDFWGVAFSDPKAEGAPVTAPAENSPTRPPDLLEELRMASQLSGDQQQLALEAVWCDLMEQLEARNVFSRDEMIASLRRIGNNLRSDPKIKSLS